MIKIQLVRGLILSAKNFQTDEIGYEVCSLMQNKKMIFVKQQKKIIADLGPLTILSLHGKYKNQKTSEAEKFICASSDVFQNAKKFILFLSKNC